MIAPDVVRPGDGQVSPFAFEGSGSLPPLPSDRVAEDLEGSPGDPVRIITMFHRTWMEDGPQLIYGTVADVTPSTTSFRLGLPGGMSFETVVSRIVEEGSGEIDPDTLRDDADPDMLRQQMLGVASLRPYVPSAGHVRIRTPKTEDIPGGGVVGIDINSVTLIPENVWPYLHNEAYLQALLRDGRADKDEREALEKLLRERIAEGNIGSDMPEIPALRPAHEPRRGRRHGVLHSGKVGGVRGDRHVSFASEPKLAVIPDPSIEHI